MDWIERREERTREWFWQKETQTWRLEKEGKVRTVSCLSIPVKFDL